MKDRPVARYIHSSRVYFYRPAAELTRGVRRPCRGACPARDLISVPLAYNQHVKVQGRRVLRLRTNRTQVAERLQRACTEQFDGLRQQARSFPPLHRTRATLFHRPRHPVVTRCQRAAGRTSRLRKEPRADGRGAQPCPARPAAAARPARGADSHGQWSHSDTAWHILYGESRLKHTKRHLNDPTAHG